MTDQAQRTAWAVQRFESFVNTFTPPALQVYCRDDIIAVRRAIRAIAPGQAAQVLGYGVYAQVPDRKRASGFEHIAICALSETLAGAENVFEGRIERAKKILAQPPIDRERQLADGSLVRLDELRGFVICQVQQIPT
jgi:hypothetical protein